MSRKALVSVILASVVAMAAGCAAPSAPASEPVATYPTPEYGMDALLSGTLRLVDGCLVIVAGEDSIVVPVFPSDDASWDADAAALTWNGESYRDGDALSLGGGYSGAEIEGAYVPEECQVEEPFLVAPASAAP